MKKIDDITIDEILKVFTESNSLLDVMKHYGYTNSGGGYNFTQKLIQKANINVNEFFQKKITKEIYSKNPKVCKTCGKILSFEQRNNTFCSRSCATIYLNKNRGQRDIETRAKIASTLSKKNITPADIKARNYTCKYCGNEIKQGKFCCVECFHKFNYEKKIKEWLSGKVFTRGGHQIPEFIRKYLFEKHNNQCEKCGWHEINPITGKIPLQIHHIDGDCTNNKIENLQLLCPNCHSLTETFGSLNENSKRFHRKKILKQ